jgi:glutathione S-transferase
MSIGTLYGFALSPFVRAVRIALHEKGLAYDHQPHGFEEIKTPAYGAINPFHKIPAWVAPDGFTVYETPAILRFLDEAEPGVALTPGTPRDLARMAQWVGVAGSVLYPVGITQLVVQRLVMPLMGGTTDEGIVTSAAETTGRHLDALEAALVGPWLAGGGFSQADIMVGVMLDLIDLAPEGMALVATRPATGAFLARLRARPSFDATFPEMLAGHRRR